MVNMTGFLNTIKASVRASVISNGSHLAVGTDNTAATVGDTILGNELIRKARQEYTEGASDVITSLWLSSVEGNDASLKEVGMLDGADEAVDDCDTADWSDSTDMTTSLNSTTYWEGNGSLNLTKDGSSSATASTFKTTTSLDFTDKGLRLILYIIDAAALAKLAASNCLTIRFGSSSSDYYEWQKDLTDLVVGRNDISGLTSSNADSTVGTPVLGSCDYTYVGLTADASGTTWSSGDFIMDDIAIFNANLLVRDVYTAVSKSNSMELWIDIEEQIEVTQ